MFIQLSYVSLPLQVHSASETRIYSALLDVALVRCKLGILSCIQFRRHLLLTATTPGLSGPSLVILSKLVM